MADSRTSVRFTVLFAFIAACLSVSIYVAWAWQGGDESNVSAVSGASFAESPPALDLRRPAVPDPGDSPSDSTSAESPSTSFLTFYEEYGFGEEAGNDPDGSDESLPPSQPPGEPPFPGELYWQDRPDDSFLPGAATGPISGRVTDPWGNGIPGIQVYLDYVVCMSRGCGPNPPAAITDAAGYYAIYQEPVPEPYPPDVYGYGEESNGPVINRVTHPFEATQLNGSYTIYFSGKVHGFYASEWYNDQKPAFLGPHTDDKIPAGSSGIDAVLVPYGVLGVSTDVDGVTYAIFRADRQTPVYTGKSWGSNFAIGNLEPGSYKLAVTAAAVDQEPRVFWYGGSSWETARPIAISGAGTTTVVMNVAGPQLDNYSSIYGTVMFDSMLPPAGSTLSLLDSDGAPRGQKVLSPSDFTFTFKDLEWGTYELRVALPDGRTVHEQEAVVPAAGPIEIRADVPGATVSGTVKRPDGTPVGGLGIRAIRLDDWWTLSDPMSISRASGDFAFGPDRMGRLDPGTYQFCAVLATSDSTEEVCHPRIINVAWYSVVETIDIVVPQDFGLPFELSGRIQRPDGSGVSGVKVHLNNYPQDITVTSGDNGEYQLGPAEGLIAGSYYIYVEGHDLRHSLYVSSILWGDVLKDRDITVPQDFQIAGRLSGETQYPDGGPAPYIQLAISSVDGSRTVTESSWHNGSFSSTLYPGEYRVCAIGGQNYEYCLPGTVTIASAAETGGIIVPVPQEIHFPAHVSGSLKIGGTALSEGLVKVYPQSPGSYLPMEKRTGDSGWFDFYLAPGVYRICASNAAGEQCYPQEISVTWEDHLHNLNITVDQSFKSPTEISGRVVRADGSGAPNVSVELREGWPPVITATTDSQGYFRVTDADGLTPGTYDIAVIWEGNTITCSGCVTVEWRSMITNIVVTVPQEFGEPFSVPQLQVVPAGDAEPAIPAGGQPTDEPPLPPPQAPAASNQYDS